MESDQNKDQVADDLSAASAWMALRVVRALVLRDGVDMAMLCLQAALRGSAGLANQNTELLSKIYAVMREVTALYEHEFAEWCEFALEQQRGTEYLGHALRPEQLDALFAEARTILTRSLDQIAETRRILPGESESRRKLLSCLLDSVTMRNDLRSRFPGLFDAPSDPYEAAYNALKVLGYDDRVVQSAMARLAGFTESASDGSRDAR